MLYSCVSGKQIGREDMHHKSQFDAWCRRLGKNLQVILAEIDKRVGNQQEVDSSWLLAEGWEEELAPIRRACGGNIRSASKFAGLLLMAVIIDRQESWCVGVSRQTRGKSYRRYTP